VVELVERLLEGEGGVAAEAKNDFDPELSEGLDRRFAAIHLGHSNGGEGF
jgi:hypothetical protein